MVKVRCVGKKCNSHGVVTHYKLQDECGNILIRTAAQVRQDILSKQIICSNLSLSANSMYITERIVARCIRKTTDTSGTDVSYTLKDEQGNIVTFTTAQMKKFLSDGRLECSNLMLSPSNTIIERSIYATCVSVEASASNDTMYVLADANNHTVRFSENQLKPLIMQGELVCDNLSLIDTSKIKHVIFLYVIGARYDKQGKIAYYICQDSNGNILVISAWTLAYLIAKGYVVTNSAVFRPDGQPVHYGSPLGDITVTLVPKPTDSGTLLITVIPKSMSSSTNILVTPKPEALENPNYILVTPNPTSISVHVDILFTPNPEISGTNSVCAGAVM